MAYKQPNNPFVKTQCGRRYAPLAVQIKAKFNSPFAKADPPRTIGKGKNFNPVSKDKSARGGAAGGGMSEKGVAAYKRNNPDSNLQTAVTEKNPKGERLKRKRGFCARSRGWTGERGRAARRRWRC